MYKVIEGDRVHNVDRFSWLSNKQAVATVCQEWDRLKDFFQSQSDINIGLEILHPKNCLDESMDEKVLDLIKKSETDNTLISGVLDQWQTLRRLLQKCQVEENMSLMERWEWIFDAKRHNVRKTTNILVEIMICYGKLGTRHAQLLLITACVTCGSSVNYSLTVAIVEMTNSKNHSWTSSEISLVLSAFNWGFMALLIPSGYLVNLFSPKRLFAYALLFGSTANLFVPLLVQWADWKGACAGRVALGLGEAFINVCAYALLSKWAPPKERSLMCAIMTSGYILGALIATSVSGFIASSWIGWPGIFYFFGVGGIIPALLLAVYGADSPQVHPSISPDERAFIAECFREVKNFTEFKSRKIPWKEMLTSMPVWSIVIAQCGVNWAVMMDTYEVPIYMKYGMQFETVKVSLIATLAHIALWLLIYVFGWISDYALLRGLSVSTVRRFFNTLGLWTTALTALGLSFGGPEHETLTIGLYILMVGMKSGGFCGFLVNQIDLSPNFAGTIQSIVVFVGMVMWIIAPIICGAIVTDLTNTQQWKIIFYITASVLFLSNVIFIIFASGDIQPWDGLSDHEQNVKNEESEKLRETTVRA